MKKIQFRSDNPLVEQCYEQLQNEIIEGVLKPGQKIKVEPLKERFSIGQSPIREALSRLAASGLVEVKPNRGFQVAPVSEQDIRDVYNIFTQIEHLALALSIQKGDNAWEAEIMASLHKLSLIENKKGHISYNEWKEHNYNFHLALIAGCNSPTLLEIRRLLYLKFDRYCRISFTLQNQQLHANHEEHRLLAQAVINRDLKTAQAHMTYHINGTIEDVIKLFKENNIITERK